MRGFIPPISEEDETESNSENTKTKMELLAMCWQMYARALRGREGR